MLHLNVIVEYVLLLFAKVLYVKMHREREKMRPNLVTFIEMYERDA